MLIEITHTATRFIHARAEPHLDNLHPQFLTAPFGLPVSWILDLSHKKSKRHVFEPARPLGQYKWYIDILNWSTFDESISWVFSTWISSVAFIEPNYRKFLVQYKFIIHFLDEKSWAAFLTCQDVEQYISNRRCRSINPSRNWYNFASPKKLAALSI
jgi:hypothetical protein